jgi:excisionase family DNA binding protein
MMLTLDQVAEEMQVTRRYVEKLIASGDLDSYKIGRCRRVDRIDFDGFLYRKRAMVSPATKRDIGEGQ